MPANGTASWAEKVKQQLDMAGGKKQLSLRARRVPVNDSTFHLIIGLGGTGCDAVLETKGYIELTCENSGSRVAYLGIDTDKDQRNKKSSAETGEAKFTDQEFCLLESSGVKDIFKAANIESAVEHNPELFTWVDTDISTNVNNDGAAGTRQVGRLILQKNYDIIVEKIAAAVKRIIVTNDSYPANARLMIYLISGISGGTGSGTFFDMPYIISDVLKNGNFGFASGKHNIFGYFFMPDVNENNGGDKAMLYRNAYAALQELDYAMRMAEYKESFTLNYPHNTKVVVRDESPFNKVHLVSATTSGGALVPDPYRFSMRAIAQNILSFVANEETTDDKGATTFAISEHYSNIEQQTETVLTKLDLPHRFHQYLAIGSSQYELPIDDIMMYVASLLFENMKTMYDRDPSQDDGFATSFEGQLGWTLDGLLGKLRGNIPGAGAMGQKVVDQILKSSWVLQGQNAYNSIVAQKNGGGLRPVIDTVVRACKSEFDELMKNYFEDPAKGPVYVNHLINNPGGLVDRLRANMNDVAGYVSMTPEANPNIQRLGGDYSAAEEKLRKAILSSTKSEAAAKVNQIGRQYFEECVRMALASAVRDVSAQLIEYVQEQNSRLFDVVVTVLAELQSIFQNNANILTNGQLQVEGAARHFTWDTLDIPTVSGVIKEKFDAISRGKIEPMIGGFATALWTEAHKWIGNPTTYDPKAFVSDFIDQQFSRIAELSIEDIVAELLNRDPAHATTLDNSIQQVLMPKLIQDAKPLFYEKPGLLFHVPVKELMLISVPNKCTGIYGAVKNYCDENFVEGDKKNYILQRSDINNRIYVQTVRCALPLSSFNTVWMAERTYAQYRDVHGVHLVNAVGQYAPEKKTWNDLCTLIPLPLRPKGTEDEYVRVLMDEERARKKRVAELLKKQPPLPMLSLDKRPNQWTLSFNLTVSLVKIEGSKLEIRERGKVLKSYDYNTVSGADEEILLAELQSLRAKGIPGDVTTRKISAKVIMEDVEGVSQPNERRTSELLLESYLCAYELVRSVEKEAAKYDALDAYIEQFQKHTEETAGARKLMFDFSKLLLLDKVTARIDINTGNTCMYFSDDPINPVSSFGNGIAPDDFRLNPSIYSAYRSIVSSTDRQTDHLRVRLNKLFSEVQQQMQAAVLDAGVRDQLLSLIQKKDYEKTLNALRMRPGIKQSYLDFYDELVRQLKLLESSLAPATSATVVSGLSSGTEAKQPAANTIPSFSIDDDFEL